MRLHLTVLCALCWGLAPAGESATPPPARSGDDAPFAQAIVLHSWRDKPSEFLTEVNYRLPPHLRFAWYVDPNTDGAVYPGPVLGVAGAGKPVAELLTAYCEATGLAWSHRDRAVWIHKQEDPVGDAKLAQDLLAADAAVRKPAMAAIVSAPTPGRMRALVKGLGSQDAAVAQDAWRYLAMALGASEKAFYHRKQMAHDIFVGLEPHLWQPRAMICNYGWPKVAPWVWAYVALADDGAAAVVGAKLKAQAPEEAVGDFPLLVMGALALRDEVVPALRERAKPSVPKKDPKTGKNARGYEYRSVALSEGFGAWTDNWCTAKAKEILGWMAQRKDGAWPQAVDYAAEAAKARAGIMEYAEVEAQKARIEEARKQLPAAVEEEARVRREHPKDKKLIKEAEEARKRLEYQINDANKALKGSEKTDMRSIAHLAGQREHLGLFDPAAVALVAVAAEPRNQLHVRRKCLQELQNFRGVPQVVPALAKILEEDKEPLMRDLAGQCLGILRTPEGIAVLKKAVADEGDRFLRQGGAIGLALSHHPDGAEKILAAVGRCTTDEQREERNYLLQVLGLCRDEAANAELTRIAREGEALTDRVAATLGLSLVPTDAAQAVLVELINNPKETLSLRDAAVKGLTPADGEQARRMIPILLDALPDQTDAELGKGMVDAIWIGVKYLSAGTPLKAEVGEVCLRVFQDPKVPTMVRTRILNVFKNTDNTPRTLEILQQAMAKEKNPVLKQFIKNAIGNVESGLKAGGGAAEE